MATTTAPGIFNDVLGPVMRGPSSSHTAGSFHIAVLARALLGDRPARARVVFDPAGSYARVYEQQGVDRAFAAGLLGWALTDDRFFDALGEAARGGLAIAFVVAPLEDADHPNTVEIALESAAGRTVTVRAASVGGGAILVTRVDGGPVRLRGETWAVLVDGTTATIGDVRGVLAADGAAAGDASVAMDGSGALVVQSRVEPMPLPMREALAARPGVGRVREAPPIAFVKKGEPIFGSGREMLDLAARRGLSLGEAALAYESALLRVPEPDLVAEMHRRFEIMRAAVRAGLDPSHPALQLLAPTAGKVMEAEARGRVAIGGLHTRAAARAMAVMHVNGAMGIVCAAPTGGSAGVLPGVIVSLAEERSVGGDAIARALFAAAAIGLVVSFRATFAAEVAGCQVEIGAAGAMAAAAVVEAAGGSARQAADAAAIAFQNTMGSVCDLVQGLVEIPCHTRNAVGAASAFVCADLVMGGYENPIDLDETIDAVYAVGRAMPPELRCTARGGLAVAPSALKLQRRAPARQ